MSIARLLDALRPDWIRVEAASATEAIERHSQETIDLALLDLTAYGRQEAWEDSPPGWPQPWGEGKQRMRRDGRPLGQWSRLEAGISDDLSDAR